MRAFINTIFLYCFRVDRSPSKHFRGSCNVTIQEHKSESDLILALKRCCTTGDLEYGKRIHQQAKRFNFLSISLVANTLIHMYGKLGDMKQAKNVFNTIQDRNIVSWNCLLLGYVENGESSTAMELFAGIDSQPDHVTYVAALKACVSLNSDREIVLEKATAVHRHAELHGVDSNIFVSNTLIDVYSKCREMASARAVFDKMPVKTVFTWTCLISGYVLNGESFSALDVFSRMDCQPNEVTYLVALKACTSLAGGSASDRDGALEKGVEIHRAIRETGFDGHITISNTLINMYGKLGDMRLARETFDSMPVRNIVSWSCLLLGYIENGDFHVALELYEKVNCKPNAYTYVAAVKACTGLASRRQSEKLKALEEGGRIHRQVDESGLEGDIVLASALIDMYCKCGRIELAKGLFDKMVRKDVVAWTCLMLGYVDNGETDPAFRLFDSMDCEPSQVTLIAALKACATGLADGGSSERKRMLLERAGVVRGMIKERSLDSNLVVANSLVDLYIKAGEMNSARALFEKMLRKDVVTWNCMILGYIENGQSERALELFTNMDCQPDLLTYVGALKACGTLAEERLGRSIHGRVCKLGLEGEDLVMANALVDFYGRCGCTPTALHVFSTIPSPDIVSWNSLLGGYSLLGDSSRVFYLMEEILEAGLKPDGITFLSLLSACSHAGKVAEGERYFNSMRRHSVAPSLEHFGCMVDMLSRANKVEEAVSVINRMPFTADEATWNSLLGGCRQRNKLEVARVAFERLLSGDRTVRAAGGFALMGEVLSSAAGDEKCGELGGMAKSKDWKLV